jgi:hypothetical protein
VIVAALELAGRFTPGPGGAGHGQAAIHWGLETDPEPGLRLECYLFSRLFGTDDKEIGAKSFTENGPGKAVLSPPAH